MGWKRKDRVGWGEEGIEVVERSSRGEVGLRTGEDEGWRKGWIRYGLGRVCHDGAVKVREEETVVFSGSGMEK